MAGESKDGSDDREGNRFQKVSMAISASGNRTFDGQRLHAPCIWLCGPLVAFKRGVGQILNEGEARSSWRGRGQTRGFVV